MTGPSEDPAPETGTDPPPGAHSHPEQAPNSAPAATADGRPDPREPRHRPLIERLGLAFVALVLASLFGAVAAASWTGGEPFLAAMGAIGCLMTLWVGTLTLFRG